MKHLLCIDWVGVLSIIGGTIWAYIEPNIDFAWICLVAVFLDCMSAWRLNRRIRRAYGDKASDGKLKSRHMRKIVNDIFMLFGVIFIAQAVDNMADGVMPISLAKSIACVYLIIELISICENESSCNGSRWALVMQKFISDKSERHLEVDIKKLMDEAEEELNATGVENKTDGGDGKAEEELNTTGVENKTGGSEGDATGVEHKTAKRKPGTRKKNAQANKNSNKKE